MHLTFNSTIIVSFHHCKENIVHWDAISVRKKQESLPDDAVVVSSYYRLAIILFALSNTKYI